MGDCVTSISAGRSVNGYDESAGNGEKGVLKTSSVSTGSFRPSENKRVLESETHLLSAPVAAGTIILGRSNTIGLVGASALVREDHPNLFLSDKLWAVQVKGTFDPGWMHAYLSLPQVRAELRELASGSSAGMKNISRQSFRDLTVLHPPLPEQRKIADILGAWDDAIDTLAVTATNKRIRRELLIDQLVFPAGKPHGLSMDRIPSGWRVQQIGDVASEISIRNHHLDATVVLTCSKHRGFLRNADYFDRSTQGADLSGYKQIHRNQFGFPSNHVEEGSIGVQNIVDVGIVSPIYTVFEFDSQVEAQFAFLVLKTNAYRHMFKVSTSASVDRRGSLRWGAFSRLPFPIPPVAEQRAISRAVAAVDEELALLDREIALLREQKRGLMQKLLTGDIRVTVDSTEEVTP